MQLLTEQTSPLLIADIIRKSAAVKIAVAFWGKGAVEMLGLDRPGLRASIVCNLESGACNPTEIKKLLSLSRNVEVRTNARLHAKVYWSADKAVIGSSNASSNGLAVEGSELQGWAEANVLLTDPRILVETDAWFNVLFSESVAVDDTALQRAEENWRKRSKIRPPVAEKVKPETTPSLSLSSVDRERLIRQFGRAMRGIYVEAQKAGYTPHAFGDMLSRLGAMETARRLVLANSQSDGFTRLFLMGKKDLTVEALVLKEPWRQLFDADFLSAAETRLKIQTRL
ncbi:phospholipase D family protein [Rhizobium sp. Root482]|uniref:phospholipase D family protein n=1 Tax=Rhizobium sp. Root482 TaxID=1736543 RepID=UPI0006FE5C63|nr:phospholipase D family protein [Rhizobium sp. Root482]KQY13678.1 hypothetical protein ASD31_10775 [Rhizobium sp. Root482]